MPSPLRNVILYVYSNYLLFNILAHLSHTLFYTHYHTYLVSPTLYLIHYLRPYFTHIISHTTLLRSGETYHYSMFHNPTAAVNLFHVGKQYLTLCKAEAAVTRNLICRKIIFQRQTR